MSDLPNLGVDTGTWDDADPYTALRASTTRGGKRRNKRAGKQKRGQTAPVGVGGPQTLHSQLNFRNIGRSPQMPNTTPSLRDQLYKLRMGNEQQRPLPQVESAKKAQERKRAVHNLNVKARLQSMLSGAQDRSVIQKIRKENKQLSAKLKSAHDDLSLARAEIDKLQRELERVRNTGTPLGSLGKASADGSRPTTPATPVMSPRPNFTRKSSNSKIVRRSKTSIKLSRTSTNDFAGFRARSTLHRVRFSMTGANHFPQQLAIKFPFNFTALNLDDKTEDLLISLQESGTTNTSVLTFLNKLLEVIGLIAACSASVDDIGELCEIAQTTVQQMVGSEVANIWLADSDTNKLRCHQNKTTTSVSAAAGMVGQAFQTRASVVVPESLSEKAEFIEEADACGVAGQAYNCIAVPLFGHNTDVVGVLQCINRPHGAYTDLEESLLRQCGRLLGPILLRSIKQMQRNVDLTAHIEITQATTKLYASLASVSVDTEKPDTLDVARTLVALQTQARRFAERLTGQDVDVRVHVVKQYSSMAAAETLASLAPKELRDSQDMTFSKSRNGIVGNVFRLVTSEFHDDAASQPHFNENVDLVASPGYATYTVPAFIVGHQSPLAVLQVTQPQTSLSQQKMFLEYYERFASEVAFVLLYFYNIDSLQKAAEAPADGEK